ncbi:MAG: imidazole glycerol phosphate synthase subunit HisF [Candidatus Gracilibacteria bacterium]
MGSIFYEGSLLTKRIIPCLDVKDGRTVKGVNFLNLRDAGDPVELAKLYSKQGADELCFLDITASTDRRKTIVDLVQKVAKEIDIPFTVGGGINTIEDISAVLMAGADKVSISSGIVKNPDLINKATKAFGSQCIVASLDVKKVGTSWKITIKGGREITSLDAIEWAKEVEERGAGEILLNSMDRDGTKLGFDIELLRAVKNVVKIPVIASGGAGTIEDFVELLKADVADAALAASVFHFGEIRIPELKKVLLSNYLMIRPGLILKS